MNITEKIDSVIAKLVDTFNSPGVSADPPDVLPRSPGTGVPGALPPEEDCLALSFFLVSLTDDKWLFNNLSFFSRFSELIFKILKCFTRDVNIIII